jgi:hypothetical protein
MSISGTDLSGKVGVLGASRFCVSDVLIAETEQFLKDVGEQGFEGLMLWAGSVRADSPTIIDVVGCIAPDQTLVRGEDGVGLHVDGDELFRLNAMLYRKRLLLIGQVHSHPSQAYHSTTDDRYAVVTIPGGLSIVVPDFARHGFCLDSAAVYRLTAQGEWAKLSSATAQQLIRIEARDKTWD